MILRTASGILLEITILAAVAGIPALAQGPGRQGHAYRYNPATEVHETGIVEDVRQAGGNRGWSGTHLLVRTDKEDLDVHLGPAAFVAQSGFGFAKGDQIEVCGSRVKIGATDALLAREVRKGGKTLVLRDANGVPKWSRRQGGI